MDTSAIRTETTPLMLLFDSGNVVQRVLEQRLHSFGLSVAQQRILTLLLLTQEPLTPTLLAGALLQETHSVSGLLNRLEDRDLVTRTRQRQDRRVVFVGLTEAGRSLAEAAT
jgi:DNA-binding MarR family transcriptional regulator